MQVTDFRWIHKNSKGVEEHRKGYYMDEFLATNLMRIPKFLRKSWDTVGIISGHGKVRIGKLLPNGSNILMSNGNWKKIENVNIGDKVISPSVNGKNSTISNVVDKIKHKDREMCEIRSSKDNKLLYKCCTEHQVPVRTLWIKTSKKGKLTEYYFKDEIYFAEDLANKNERWFKNHCPKIITSPTIDKYEKKNCKVNPYLMGLYIGDGHIRSKNRIAITNPDPEILKWLQNNTSIKNISKNNKCPTISILYPSKKIQSLCGNGSYHKKIPNSAITSDYNYRKRLLEGLLDTDAYINKNGYVIYTTASERLAFDVKKLVKTLGCRASIKITYKNCQTFDKKRKYYNVNINLGLLSKTLNILRKSRAKRLLNLDLSNTQNKENQYEGIKVIKTLEKLDGYCIEVESKSHLYITDNYCVTHNSTMAQQIGYFVAWLLAGGDMDQEKKKWFVCKRPQKKVNFNLEENIVFGPQELMDKAASLYKKYGKHQVIIYDEGRAGLDSARAMAAINKIMQDFFQECGMYGHVILIVLPNYFKLHEDYAVARSLFLIDVYADTNMNRGFFRFYNERQKEFLYYQGKKKIGTLKYNGVNPSFSGRFTKFLPLDDDEYNEAKMRAIKKKELAKTERKWKHQRDALIYLMKSQGIMTYEEMAREMTVICGTAITKDMMLHGYHNITKEIGDEDPSD